PYTTLFRSIVVRAHGIDPLNAVTHAPVVPSIGQVGGRRELRVVDHAGVVFQRVIGEQLVRDFRVLGDAQVEQRRARSDVLAVTHGVVEALDVIGRQVDVVVLDGQGALSITRNQAAEADVVLEVFRVRVIAAGQDVACTGARHAVFNFDFVVIDGERQVAPALRQARLQNQADREVGRGFSGQARFCAPSRDDGDAAGLLPIRRQTFGGAVGDAVRVDVGS